MLERLTQTNLTFFHWMALGVPIMEERMRLLAELGTRCQEVCSPLYLPVLTKITASLVDLADQLGEAR